MANKNDTDPSMPEALKPAGKGTDPSPAPRLQSSTQRGLGGPPSRPPPVPVTAPAGQPGQKKDSVELLLDGMQGTQEAPPNTMPQTAGQSSAAYQAEHVVKPAHTSPDVEPSVVVERPPQHPTLKIERGKLEAVIAEGEARRVAAAAAAQQAEMQAQAQAGLPMGLRVAIAVVAGLAVVLGIFLLVRPSTGAVAAPVASATATSGTATSTVPAAATIPPTPTVTATVAATDLPVAAPTDPSPPVAPPAGTLRPRPRASGSPPSGLGEFKPTFH